MFRKLQRQLDADSRMMKEAEESARRKAESEQARLDEPLTRREVIGAIETVAWGYACNGDHDSDLVANAFRALKDVLS